MPKGKYPSGVPFFGRPTYAQTPFQRMLAWLHTPSPSMIQHQRMKPFTMYGYPKVYGRSDIPSRTYGR